MKAKKNSAESNSSGFGTYARYSSLAFQMLAIILFAVWGGFSLDRWLEWKFPVFTVLGSLTGVGLSIYYAVKDFIKK